MKRAVCSLLGLPPLKFPTPSISSNLSNPFMVIIVELRCKYRRPRACRKSSDQYLGALPLKQTFSVRSLVGARPCAERNRLGEQRLLYGMFSQARPHTVSVHATESSCATDRNALLVGPTPSQLPVLCIGLSTLSKGHAPIERDKSEPSGAYALKDANGMLGFRPLPIASLTRLDLASANFDPSDKKV